MILSLTIFYPFNFHLNLVLHERMDINYKLSHAINWCLQAARGISYLHSIKPKPMMHRDLKPPK